MRSRVAPLAVVGLVVLVGLNVWLLAVLTAEDAPDPTTTAAATTQWTPKLSASQDQSPGTKPVGAYTETLARPVFFKTRQPYVPPPAPPPPLPKPVVAPPPAPVDPGLALGGVMISDAARKAYVFSKSDQRGSWLGEGDTIAGWKLEAVDATSARLKQGTRSIELQLYPKR